METELRVRVIGLSWRMMNRFVCISLTSESLSHKSSLSNRRYSCSKFFVLNAFKHKVHCDIKTPAVSTVMLFQWTGAGALQFLGSEII